VRLLYKPFALIASLFAARIGRSIFRGVWSRIDTSDPPRPTSPDAPLSKVVGAAALEAATMASVAAAVNRAAARVFHQLTGAWPNQPPERKSKKKSKEKG